MIYLIPVITTTIITLFIIHNWSKSVESDGKFKLTDVAYLIAILFTSCSSLIYIGLVIVAEAIKAI